MLLFSDKAIEDERRKLATANAPHGRLSLPWRSCTVETPILVAYPSEMNRLFEWIRIDFIVLRSSGLVGLVLTFLGASVLLTTCQLAGNTMDNRKTTPDIATIVGFGLSNNKWNPGGIIVSARDPRGLMASELVAPAEIAGCRIGDQMRAERYGVALTLHPAPCPIDLSAHAAPPGPAKASATASLR